MFNCSGGLTGGPEAGSVTDPVFSLAAGTLCVDLVLVTEAERLAAGFVGLGPFRLRLTSVLTWSGWRSYATIQTLQETLSAVVCTAVAQRMNMPLVTVHEKANVVCIAVAQRMNMPLVTVHEKANDLIDGNRCRYTHSEVRLTLVWLVGSWEAPGARGILVERLSMSINLRESLWTQQEKLWFVCWQLRPGLLPCDSLFLYVPLGCAPIWCRSKCFAPQNVFALSATSATFMNICRPYEQDQLNQNHQRRSATILYLVQPCRLYQRARIQI